MEKNILLHNYHEKFPDFSGKYHVQFQNSVNFRTNIIKIWGIFDNFSSKYHVTFGHFVNFSYIIFAQKCLAPQS